MPIQSAFRSVMVVAVLISGSCSVTAPAADPPAPTGGHTDPGSPARPPAQGDTPARADSAPPAEPADAAPPVVPTDPGPSAVDAAAPAPSTDATAPARPATCPALTGGWMEYHPEKSLQFEGSSGAGTGITSHPAGMTISDDHCTYSDSGGIELFRMTKNPADVRQRCEMRVKNGYRTGFNQFEGDVRVTAGDGTCVHQIFKFLMLVAYPQNGGELHQHSQSFLASGVFGKWVHVNTVHDTATGKVDIYLDCVKKFTMNQAGPDADDGWYNKYGVYNLGGSTAQSEWRNVRFFRK